MELKMQMIRVSSVLNSFFFPLTSPEILEALAKRKFEVSRPPVPITGIRVYVGGTIARKGNVFVDVDDGRKLIGVSGGSIDDTVKTFTEILEILQEDFYVNLDTELDYVELIAQYLIKSDSNPLEVLQNCSKIKFKDALQKLLNTAVSDYRISIVPRGVLPSSKRWFEISIFPKLTMPTRAYWVEVIFRDTKSSNVISFASNLNSTISNIIKTIESKNRGNKIESES